MRPSLDAEVDEAEEDAVLALRTAAELARGLLRLGGQRDEGPVELDLREIVQDVLRMTRSAVPAEVRVEVELPEGKVVYHGRRAELVQLVMNLVVNAVQALPDGEGRLSLRLGPAASCGALESSVALLEPIADPSWCLEVEDDGVGIPREVLGRIMDPLVSFKANGHGLGLAAARGVLERVGGGLVVRSAPGRGSCFRVLLPHVVEAAPAQAHVEG